MPVEDTKQLMKEKAPQYIPINEAFWDSADVMKKMENLGRLYGTEFPERLIVVGAHYDSVSYDGETCPGAVDNATGASAVLELARIFSNYPPRVTMEFILFSGEELGLLGSKHRAKISQTKNENIKLMLNLDMIGWGTRADGTKMSIETTILNSAYATAWAEAAVRFCELPYQISYNAWGSDHIPYLRRGFPALLTTCYECENYEHYHSTNDTTEMVDREVARNFLRLNIASLSLFSGGLHFI